MNKQRSRMTSLTGGLLLLGIFFISSTGFGQTNCPSPGFNCPLASLYTDGVYFVFGTSCCTPDGPACRENFSNGLYLYNNTIPSSGMGCEADPAGAEGCKCKTSESLAGTGSGTGGNGELTFNPDDATSVSTTTGSCDDYFIKVQGTEEYYRCFNISYTYQGGLRGGKMAIRSTKRPTNFSVQNYPTIKATSGGVNMLKVQVPVGGGNTVETTFKIAQKQSSESHSPQQDGAPKK